MAEGSAVPRKTFDIAGGAQEQTEGLVIDAAAKPRHAEELSLEESAQYQPWEVTLFVQVDALDPRVHETCYYVRAPEPGAAVTLANAAWVQWAKKDKGLEFSKYPDTLGGRALGLDEKEWAYVWDEVRHKAHKRMGLEENPSVFTMVTTGE